MAQRDAAGSKQELERAIAIFSSTLGPKSSYVGSAYEDLAKEDLAKVEALLGNTQAAQRGLRRAIEVHDLSLGLRHPTRLRLQRRLAELDAMALP